MRGRESVWLIELKRTVLRWMSWSASISASSLLSILPHLIFLLHSSIPLSFTLFHSLSPYSTLFHFIKVRFTECHDATRKRTSGVCGIASMASSASKRSRLCGFSRICRLAVWMVICSFWGQFEGGRSFKRGSCGSKWESEEGRISQEYSKEWNSLKRRERRANGSQWAAF